MSKYIRISVTDQTNVHISIKARVRVKHFHGQVNNSVSINNLKRAAQTTCGIVYITPLQNT